MKKFVFLFISVISIVTTTVAQTTITSINAKNYRIVIPKGYSEYDKKAAEELQSLINKSLNIIIPIESEQYTTKSFNIYIGETLASKGIKELLKIRNDGFLIKDLANNNNLVILGKSKKSSYYGVLSFAETFLGTEYLTPSNLYISKRNEIKVPTNYTFLSNPDFVLRDIHNNLSNKEFEADKYQITYFYREPNDWGLVGHTFFKLIPKEKYLVKNPEFYSLVDDKRTASQLCLSNTGLRKEIVNNLKKLISQHPKKTHWMVGQEDVGKFCTCNDCKANYKKFGGESGLLIDFMNSISNNFREYTIGTFAYHETIAPPRNIKPNRNVLICYAPIQTFKGESILSKKNEKYAQYLRQWSNLTSNLMIWEYIGNYSNSMKPYPIIDSFQPNLLLYKKLNIHYFFGEDNNIPGISEFKELKTYLLSRLLWDSSANVDSLIFSFCNKFYGNSSKYILEYISKINEKSKSDNIRFFEGTSQYLSLDNLVPLEKILDKALQSAQDEEIKQRILVLQASLDYAFINYGRDIHNKEYYKRIERIKKISKQQNLPWMKHNGKLINVDKLQ